MIDLFTNPIGINAAIALVPAGLGLIVAVVAIVVGARAESTGRRSEFASWLLLAAVPFVLGTTAWEAALGWHAVASWGTLGEMAQKLLALAGAVAAMGVAGMLFFGVLGRAFAR